MIGRMSPGRIMAELALKIQLERTVDVSFSGQDQVEARCGEIVDHGRPHAASYHQVTVSNEAQDRPMMRTSLTRTFRRRLVYPIADDATYLATVLNLNYNE